MKIVNIDKFINLPPGTIYSKYEPCCFEGISVKQESLSNIDDFLTESIGLDAIENDSSEDFIDKLELSKTEGISLKMDFNFTGRDGCFDKKQLFAVLENKDVEKLIDKLKECLRKTEV